MELEILDYDIKKGNSRIFGRLSIFLVACLGNVFFASILMSINFYKLGKKREIFGVLFFGLIFSFRFAMYFKGFGIAEILFNFSFQCIAGYFLAWVVWDKKIGKKKIDVNKSFVTPIMLILVALWCKSINIWYSSSYLTIVVKYFGLSSL
jgi:hypothetical protein